MVIFSALRRSTPSCRLVASFVKIQISRSRHGDRCAITAILWSSRGCGGQVHRDAPGFLIIESDTITKVASRKKMMPINGDLDARLSCAPAARDGHLCERACSFNSVQSSGPARVEVQGGWLRPGRTQVASSLELRALR